MEESQHASITCTGYVHEISIGSLLLCSAFSNPHQNLKMPDEILNTIFTFAFSRRFYSKGLAIEEHKEFKQFATEPTIFQRDLMIIRMHFT